MRISVSYVEEHNQVNGRILSDDDEHYFYYIVLYILIKKILCFVENITISFKSITTFLYIVQYCKCFIK